MFLDRLDTPRCFVNAVENYLKHIWNQLSFLKGKLPGNVKYAYDVKLT